MSRSLFFVEVEDQSKLWYESVNLTHHNNLGLPLAQKPRGYNVAHKLSRLPLWVAKYKMWKKTVSNENVEKNMRA